MAANVPEILQDLVELAAYVYAADQSVVRGDADVTGKGKAWRRSFSFFVPVRNHSLWSRGEVCERLADALNCVTDDEFRFTFAPHGGSSNFDDYLELTPDESNIPIEEVLLFSGGLDSLAGVVQESVVAKRRVALVSHCSSPKTNNTQTELVGRIHPRCRSFPALHIPVWVNKDETLTHDYTQRTRSFLYSSLAATTARMLKLNRIRFYENGITSWNLPISDQLISAKASRTTHPTALTKLESLLTVLFEHDFQIENPLIWKTKAEVVTDIDAAGCADLIQYTVSCQHTWAQTIEHPHCGSCFQCLGRRFATLASGCAEHDPAQKYKKELLTGSRQKGIERTVVESYYRTAAEIGQLNDPAFFSRYGEVSRAFSSTVLNHLSGSANATASKVLDLHRRHSHQVVDVVRNGLQMHAAAILAGTLPNSCLIALAVPDIYRTPKTSTALTAKTVATEQHEHMFKSQYSSGDDTIYHETLKLCGNLEAFQVWTDAELLSRLRPRLHTNSAMRGRSDNALRLCFRRIRRHHGFKYSRQLKKDGQD